MSLYPARVSVAGKDRIIGRVEIGVLEGKEAPLTLPETFNVSPHPFFGRLHKRRDWYIQIEEPFFLRVKKSLLGSMLNYFTLIS